LKHFLKYVIIASVGLLLLMTEGLQNFCYRQRFLQNNISQLLNCIHCEITCF